MSHDLLKEYNYTGAFSHNSDSDTNPDINPHSTARKLTLIVH